MTVLGDDGDVGDDARCRRSHRSLDLRCRHLYLHALVAVDVVHAGNKLRLARSQGRAETLGHATEDGAQTRGPRVRVLLGYGEAADIQIKTKYNPIVGGLE